LMTGSIGSKGPWLVVLGALLTSVSASVIAAETACEGGWFNTRAQIVRIVPPNAKVMRRTSDGSSTPLAADQTLCGGDKLFVPPNVQSVEYREDNQTKSLSGGEEVLISTGAARVSGRAAQFVNTIMASVSVMRAPPPRPTGTFSRGRTSSAPAPIQAVLPLASLGRQRIASDVPAVVAWHDGLAEYTGELVDDGDTVVWRDAPTSNGWCMFRANLTQVVRLRVRDAQQRTLGWNVDVVDWGSVPRPDWIGRGALVDLAPPEMAAWGIWLWQAAPEQWRLQSLAMLNLASRGEWIASYFLDTVLGEVPAVPAKQ
jgi:hypothetical protein